MLPREGSAGMRLETDFEGGSLGAILESNCCFNYPRSKLGGMRNAAFIVFSEACLEVIGQPRVVTARVFLTPQKVDVVKPIHAWLARA